MKHSSCIDNKYFHIWFEDEHFFVVDLDLKPAILLSFSHLHCRVAPNPSLQGTWSTQGGYGTHD